MEAESLGIWKTRREIGDEDPIGRNRRAKLGGAADLPVVEGVYCIAPSLDKANESEVICRKDFSSAHQLPDFFELDATRRIRLALIGTLLLDGIDSFEVLPRIPVIRDVDAEE
ncbi:hypothetical protein MUO32_25930 [Shinella sp. CPCC 101442]|uniref:hypothetical protein n=1 Tax=Shinella sp. CPCC 101442 TaxID=2932265 RepID=UPI0021530EDC|nr:hypothetical protein [Shinella sp. CPCC 101442]MCR6502471.1 hypothetical protein [Shinella sp. CPCC 101442]